MLQNAQLHTSATSCFDAQCMHPTTTSPASQHIHHTTCHTGPRNTADSLALEHVISKHQTHNAQHEAHCCSLRHVGQLTTAVSHMLATSAPGTTAPQTTAAAFGERLLEEAAQANRPQLQPGRDHSTVTLCTTQLICHSTVAASLLSTHAHLPHNTLPDTPLHPCSAVAAGQVHALVTSSSSSLCVIISLVHLALVWRTRS